MRDVSRLQRRAPAGGVPLFRKDAGPRRHRRPLPDRRAHPRRPRRLLHHPADQGGLNRLDHLDGREPLPRRPLRARDADARGRRPGRPPPARRGDLRIYDILFDYRSCSTPTPSSARCWTSRLPGGDVDGRVPLPARAVPGGAREGARPGEESVLAAAYRYGVPVYTSSPGDSSIGMNVAALRPAAAGSVRRLARRERDGGDRLRRETRGGTSAVLILGGGTPKNFSCRPSRRSRRSSGSTRRGTTTSSRSPTPGPTRAGCRAPRRPRRSRGGRSTRTGSPTRWSVTSTPRWRSRSFAPSRRPGRKADTQAPLRPPGEGWQSLGKAYPKAVSAAAVSSKKRKVAQKR